MRARGGKVCFPCACASEYFLSPSLRIGFLCSKRYYNCSSLSLIEPACGEGQQGVMAFVKESLLPYGGVSSPRWGLFPSLLVGRTVKDCQDKFSALTCVFSFSLSPPARLSFDSVLMSSLQSILPVKYWFTAGCICQDQISLLLAAVINYHRHSRPRASFITAPHTHSRLSLARLYIIKQCPETLQK